MRTTGRMHSVYCIYVYQQGPFNGPVMAQENCERSTSIIFSLLLIDTVPEIQEQRVINIHTIPSVLNVNNLTTKQVITIRGLLF